MAAVASIGGATIAQVVRRRQPTLARLEGKWAITHDGTQGVRIVVKARLLTPPSGAPP